MTNILAICKRNLFIEAIRPHLFHHNIKFVFISNSPANALMHYQSLQPDIVIMDANWSAPFYPLTGTQIIHSLSVYDPTVRIIIATTIYEPDMLVKLKTETVKGYFPKTGTNVLQQIITCIKTVHSGGKYYYQSLSLH